MNPENVRITIIVPYDHLRAIQRIAGAEGINTSALIRDMIEKCLLELKAIK